MKKQNNHLQVPTIVLPSQKIRTKFSVVLKRKVKRCLLLSVRDIHL